MKNNSNLFNTYYTQDFLKNTQDNDNGWINGVDYCATCPNRPGGPLNKSGICCCAIPSMYGPNRIT